MLGGPLFEVGQVGRADFRIPGGRRPAVAGPDVYAAGEVQVPVAPEHARRDVDDIAAGMFIQPSEVTGVVVTKRLRLARCKFEQMKLKSSQ
jgi:hypothetical protein